MGLFTVAAGIAPDDPALAIDWGIPRDQWVLSGKDQKHPKLAIG